MSDKSKKVGRISFKEISDNSRFYNGKIDSKLNVKIRKLNESIKEDYKEILLNCTHPNIQKIFYYYEQEDSISYYAFQSFSSTLEEYLKLHGNYSRKDKLDLILIIRDIVRGLKYLHDNGLVHGNICLKNIGIDLETKTVMLINCGVSDPKEPTFSSPEELNLNQNPSFASDIFSLGIVIYAILSYANNPFGTEEDEIHQNIKDESDFSWLMTDDSLSNHQQYCAMSLLNNILSKNCNTRYKISQILEHPLMWNLQRIKSHITETFLLWSRLTDDEKSKIDTQAAKELKSFRITENLTALIENIATKKLEDFLSDHPFLLHIVYEIQQNLKAENSFNTKNVDFNNNNCIPQQEPDGLSSNSEYKKLSDNIGTNKHDDSDSLLDLTDKFHHSSNRNNLSSSKDQNDSGFDDKSIISSTPEKPNRELGASSSRRSLNFSKELSNLKEIEESASEDNSSTLPCTSTSKQQEHSEPLAIKYQERLKNNLNLEDIKEIFIESSINLQNQPFNTILWNVRSISNAKLLKLYKIINYFGCKRKSHVRKINFDLIILVEFWKKNFNFNKYPITGYSFYSTQRDARKGGGIAVYSSNEYDVEIKPGFPLCEEGLINKESKVLYEIVQLEVFKSDVKVRDILVIYCPNGYNEPFIEKLNEILCQNGNENLLIMGDINIDTKDESFGSFIYQELLSRHGFEIKNKAITRFKDTDDTNGTIIDHVIAKKSYNGVAVPTSKKLSTSDHNTLFVTDQNLPIPNVDLTHKEIQIKLYREIEGFESNYEIKDKYQYGFAERSGCQDLVAKLVANISTIMDEKRKSIFVYLDLSKAIASINQDMLMQKMSKLEISKDITELTGRYLSTYMPNIQNKSFKKGTTLDEVICDFIFSVYLAHVPKIDKTKFPKTYLKIFKYGNELAMLLEVDDIEAVAEEINHDIQKVIKYLSIKFPNFSINKPKAIIFQRQQNEELATALRNCYIELTENISCFGIVIDGKLKFTKHFWSIKSKLMFAIWDMENYTIQHKLTYYYNNFQSHLTYAAFLLLRLTQTNLEELQNLQHKILKIIYDISEKVTSNDLFKNRADKTLPLMGLIFYIVNNIIFKSRDTFNEALIKVERNTSSRSNQLKINTAKMEIKNKDIEIIGPKIFNSLSREFREITEKDEFAARLKELLVSRCSSLISKEQRSMKHRHEILDPSSPTSPTYYGRK